MSNQSFSSRMQRIQKEIDEAERQAVLKRQQNSAPEDQKKQRAINEMLTWPQYRQICEEARSILLREALEYIHSVCKRSQTKEWFWQRAIYPRFDLKITDLVVWNGSNTLQLGQLVSMSFVDTTLKYPNEEIRIEFMVDASGQVSYNLSAGYDDGNKAWKSLPSFNALLDALANMALEGYISIRYSAHHYT